MKTAHDDPPKHLILKATAVALILAALTVVAYSIYVAVHQPDLQETILMGQKQVAAGSPAGFRVLVRNRVSGQPVRGAKVELALKSKSSGLIRLGRFQTDEAGTFADTIHIPDLSPGDYQLLIDAASFLGRDHLVENIVVSHSAHLFLSSDKPIYQPGQIVHLRTLILNAQTGKPFTNQAITFEISDPNGNKIFRGNGASSAFGIASADFELASELNPGRYQIRALADATTAERSMEVKHYVLPKFKIQIETDKTYYLPGQAISGTVHARYFFGRPVAGATLKLTANTMQEKPVTVTELSGMTDGGGNYPFHFTLPDFFVGLPQKNARALLDLTAEVKDTAQHSEQTTLSLAVAQSDLELAAIPEAGAFVPGVENILYVVASYPDGRPAPCKIFSGGQGYATGALGACEIKLTPSDSTQPVEITAFDQAGHQAKLNFQPDKSQSAPTLLIRADQAVYEAGQTAKITILSPETNNTIFVDVIKDGQTALTASAQLNNHRAQCALDLPPSLVGTLVVNAYTITAEGEDRGCSRILYVNPASGLRIAAKLSKTVYRPGEMAALNFTVTDSQGRSVPAALGIAAVDQSLFALQENRPGLLRQFLDSEGDLLQPRYQINFFNAPEQILQSSRSDPTLAAAYLASLEPPPGPVSISQSDDPDALSLINTLRRFQGTSEYEALRNDPQFAGAFQFAEGRGGIYSLHEATGAVKLHVAQARRKAYFNALEETLRNVCVALIFFTPLMLLAYGSITVSNGQTSENANSYDVESAARLYNKLGALSLLPLLWYPAGFWLLNASASAGWFLLAVETAVVGSVLLPAVRKTSLGAVKLSEWDVQQARVCTVAFLAQFLFSRAGLVMVLLEPAMRDDPRVLLVESLVAPFLIWVYYGFTLKKQLRARGLTAKTPLLSITLWVLAVIAILVLSSMLLPSLAGAKQKAQRISLINTLEQIEIEKELVESDNATTEPTGHAAPRVRRDFPETLLWRPELITDDRGKATLEFPLADSITTWRASIEGISAAGKMGSLELPIPVFQDFFVDLDLPVSLSLGDEISVPVACYNYLNTAQDIQLTLAGADWFACPERQTTIHLGPNEVRNTRLRIKVLRVGDRLLRVTARGTKMSDAVEREIRVRPVGEKIEHTINDTLRGNFVDDFTIPNESIPDSPQLTAKFYPSHFSEIVEGLNSIFQAPSGCFEQTSSTTYPNVLALNYLKRVGRLTPEIEIKARKLINTGYQRLLTFEVPGGGFEWFGHDPAHVGLTAYGVLEFTDMARIQPIDTTMLDRTLKWLLAQQNADGSWNQAAGMDDWSQRKLLTPYVAWSLAEAGDRSSNLDKALDYLLSHPNEISTLYGKALAANAFLARDPQSSFGKQLAAELQTGAIATPDGTVHWISSGASLTYSEGSGLEKETTALATMALMKARLWPETVKKALTWLSRAKEPAGTWGSTQATVLSIRALLAGSTTSLGQAFESVVTVEVNGQPAETFRIDKNNSDVMKQLNLTKFLRGGENRIQFRQHPAGELPFQLTGAYWMPQRPFPVPASTNSQPLQITLHYDRTTLAVNDQLHCAVTVKNNTGRRLNMAIVDLGIPPGFEVDPAAFETMREHDQVAKFEATETQVILYLRELSESAPFQFTYGLRAKYPLRVETPPSSIYEYYQPTNRAQSKPVMLEASAN